MCFIRSTNVGDFQDSKIKNVVDGHPQVEWMKMVMIFNRFKMHCTSCQGSLWWCNLGWWVQSKDKIAVITMEISALAISMEGQTSLMQCQEHVDCFFDHNGLVHHEFIPQAKLVNHQYYADVLWQLQENLQNNLKKWQNGGWLVHHDSVSNSLWPRSNWLPSLTLVTLWTCSY